MGVPDEDGPEAELPGRELSVSPHPIVERDGFQFYEITRYSPSGEWKSYKPVDHHTAVGNSHALTTDDRRRRAAASLARDANAERKLVRAMEYEEKVYSKLEAVAQLQALIVDLANDPDQSPSREEMEKLRLGLAASESILNRALGKPKSQADINISHSVADQIAQADADWIIDD